MQNLTIPTLAIFLLSVVSGGSIDVKIVENSPERFVFDAHWGRSFEGIVSTDTDGVVSLLGVDDIVFLIFEGSIGSTDIFVFDVNFENVSERVASGARISGYTPGFGIFHEPPVIFPGDGTIPGPPSALDLGPFGARFVFGPPYPPPIPDGGSTGLLLGLALGAGCVLGRRR
jgi:hypothetical protein